jgi:hypothetical protein
MKLLDGADVMRNAIKVIWLYTIYCLQLRSDAY